jgi:uncharacterized membrane protein YqjE
MADRVETIHREFDRSTTDIVQDVVRDMGEMVRSEIRLAKAEMKESAQAAAKAGVFFAGAALCGLFAFACVVSLLVWLLMLAIPFGAAAGAIAVLLGAVAGGAFLMGRNKMREVRPVPQRTVQTLKEPLR